MHRVTIKDIAKIAGVSVSTVSRALRDSSEIGEETKSRIREICEREGYKVNMAARSLVANQSNVLSFIVPEITNPYHSQLAMCIEKYARSLGYNVIICSDMHDRNTSISLFDFCIGHQIDGIIIASSENAASELIKDYDSTIPIVLLGTPVLGESTEEINSVTVDNRAGGIIAANHLISLGHKKIVYLGYRPTSSTHVTRLEGFISATEAAGVEVKIVENNHSSSSMVYGFELANKLFDEGCDATAVFAATDSIAIGFLEIAEQRGIRIPEDISLLGFDNIFYASLPKINLSTIDQNSEMLAKASVDLLLSVIKEKEHMGYTLRVIPPTLVERKTCKPLE